MGNACATNRRSACSSLGRPCNDRSASKIVKEWEERTDQRIFFLKNAKLGVVSAFHEPAIAIDRSERLLLFVIVVGLGWTTPSLTSRFLEARPFRRRPVNASGAGLPSRLIGGFQRDFDVQVVRQKERHVGQCFPDGNDFNVGDALNTRFI